MDDTTILMVEDNPDDVTLTECAFEDAGIRIPLRVVGTAEAAMAYLAQEGQYADRTAYPMPRAVLLDLGLPGKSGHELLQWMAARQELRHVIRIVLTGSLDPKDLKMAFELGANAYLVKPLTVAQLINPGRSIRMLLGSGREPLKRAA